MIFDYSSLYQRGIICSIILFLQFHIVRSATTPQSSFRMILQYNKNVNMNELNICMNGVPVAVSIHPIEGGRDNDQQFMHIDIPSIHIPKIHRQSQVLEIYHPNIQYPKFQIHVSETENKSENFSIFQLDEYFQRIIQHQTQEHALLVKPIQYLSYELPPSAFNIFQFLQQPMILIGIFSFALMWCLPKLQARQAEEEHAQQRYELEQQLEHNQVSADSTIPDSMFLQNLIQIRKKNQR